MTTAAVAARAARPAVAAAAAAAVPWAASQVRGCAPLSTKDFIVWAQAGAQAGSRPCGSSLWRGRGPGQNGGSREAVKEAAASSATSLADQGRVAARLGQTVFGVAPVQQAMPGGSQAGEDAGKGRGAPGRRHGPLHGGTAQVPAETRQRQGRQAAGGAHASAGTSQPSEVPGNQVPQRRGCRCFPSSQVLQQWPGQRRGKLPAQAGVASQPQLSQVSQRPGGGPGAWQRWPGECVAGEHQPVEGRVCPGWGKPAGEVVVRKLRRASRQGWEWQMTHDKRTCAGAAPSRQEGGCVGVGS